MREGDGKSVLAIPVSVTTRKRLVPGYGDHRIQSLPASLSRAGALRWRCTYLHIDEIR
jgi:hypothetical protein